MQLGIMRSLPNRTTCEHVEESARPIVHGGGNACVVLPHGQALSCGTSDRITHLQCSAQWAPRGTQPRGSDVIATLWNTTEQAKLNKLGSTRSAPDCKPLTKGFLTRTWQAHATPDRRKLQSEGYSVPCGVSEP